MHGPDSPFAAQFVPAADSRYCSPGQTGSATCQNLVSPRLINRVVIHALCVPGDANASGVEKVIRNWQNPGPVSAHYLVDRDGTITQMVREDDAAFHIEGANQDSIGVEHADVCNEPTPFTPELYLSSAALLRDIASRYGFYPDSTTVGGA